MELASLEVKIDSTGVQKGTKDLAAFESQAQKAENAASKLWKQMVALGAVVGLTSLVKDLISVNSEFQRLSAMLVTVTGSSQQASLVFKQLETFAAETPYQLTEVTRAWVQMKALGMDPSMTALKAYGDMASSFSVDLMTAITAVSHAAMGETRTLKDNFGIQAEAMGDKIRFVFKGASTEVNRDIDSIQKYIIKLSQSNFADGMKRQMDTIGGAWSNFRDQVDATERAVGESGFGRQMIGWIQQMTSALSAQTPAIVAWASSIIGGVVDTVTWLTRHKDLLLAIGVAYTTLQIAPVIAGWVKSLQAMVAAQKAAILAVAAYDAATGAMAVSTTAAAVGTKALSGAVAALGGPVGVIITVLGALAAAYALMGDKAEEARRKATGAAQDELTRLKEENRKMWESLRQKDGKTVESRASDSTLEAIRNTIRVAGELQVELQRLEALPTSDSEKGSVSDLANKIRIGSLKEQIAAQVKLNHELNEEMIKRDALKKQVEGAISPYKAPKPQDQTLEQMRKAQAFIDEMRAKTAKAVFHLDDQDATFLKAGLLEEVRLTDEARGALQRYLPTGQERLKLTRAQKDELQQLLKSLREAAQADYDFTRRFTEGNAAAEASSQAWGKWRDDLEELEAQLKPADEALRAYVRTLGDMQTLYSEGRVSERQFQFGVDDLTQKLQQSLPVQTRLFGDLRDTIQDWSRKSADAVVEWAFTTKMTFSDVINSMLKDLARLTVQKNVTGPLFNGLSGWIGSWGSGGDSGVSDYVGTFGDTFSNGPAVTPMAAMATSAPSNITVNVDANGSVTTEGDVKANAKALGEFVATRVNQALIEHKRPGGLLAEKR